MGARLTSFTLLIGSRGARELAPGFMHAARLNFRDPQMQPATISKFYDFGPGLARLISKSLRGMLVGIDPRWCRGVSTNTNAIVGRIYF